MYRTTTLLVSLALATTLGCSDEEETSAQDTGTGDMAMEDSSMGDMAMGDAGDAIPETMGMSAAGTFYVTYALDGAPGVGDTFAMTVSVFESDESTAVTDAMLTLEETMVAMGHGMDTEPAIATNGDGTFAVSNLAYTMEGVWQYDFTVMSGERMDTIAFAATCCE